MWFTKPSKIFVDAEGLKAVKTWVFDEFRADIERDGARIDCVVYATATRTETAQGVRYSINSKTGGMDQLKPLLVLHAAQGLREVARKSGNYHFIAHLPLKQRLLFRLLMLLPS